MANIRTQIAFGFALVAAAGFLGTAPAQAQFYSAQQMAQIQAQQGQSRCPRTVAETNEWVGNLSKALARSEIQADDNPLLLADVGYYKAELGFAKTCGRTAAR